MRPLARLLLVIVLVAVGARGLETRWAFAQLWLPLASRLTPGQLSADGGRLRLSGGLEAEGLRWRSGARRLDASRVRLELAPLASLRARAPYLKHLELHGLRVDWAAAEPPASRAAAALAPRYALPLFVERAELGPAELRIGAAELRVEGLVARDVVPGRRGDVALRLSGTHSATEPTRGWRGSARLDAVLDVPETKDAALAVELSLDAQLEELALAAWQPGPTALALRARGSLEPGGRLSLESLALDGERGDAPLGHVELAGALVLGAAPRLDGRLRASAPGDALARSLGVDLGRVEPALAAAQLEAELAFAGPLRALQLEGALRVDGVRLGPDQPPTRLALEHACAVAPQRLEDCEASLTIHSEERDAGRLHATGAFTRGDGGWQGRVRFDHEAVALASWLRWLGHGPPASVQALVASGEGRVELAADAALRVSLDERARIELDHDEHLELRLRDGELERSEPGRFAFRGALEGPGRGAEPGLVSLSGTFTGDETRATRSLELAGSVEGLDATPLLVLLTRGLGDGDAPEPRGESPPLGLDVELSLEDLRLRELAVADGRLRLAQGPERLDVALEDLVLAQGTLDASLSHHVEQGTQRLRWQAEAHELDLEALLATLAPEREGGLSGRLTLTTRGEGQAPRDADPLEAADGTLRLAFDDARAAGLPLLRYVAERVGVGDFTDLGLDALSGEFPVRRGAVEVGRAEVGAGAAHLVLSGDFGLREVDARVNPRVGPGLAPQLAPRFAGTLLATASGLLALPLEITVRGPWSELRYGARPVPPTRIDRLFGGLLGAAGTLLGGGGATAEGS